MKKAAVVIDDGFEEVEALAPVDMLKRAGVDVDLISNNADTAHTGRSGILVEKLIPFNDYDFSSADALILPGGAHYQKLEANKDLLRQVRNFFEDEDKILGAICASPTILGRMGLLEGKEYTCYVPMNEEFNGVFNPDVEVVCDGNLITGRSAAAGIEFGLELVDSLLGDEAMEKVKKDIIY